MSRIKKKKISWKILPMGSTRNAQSKTIRPFINRFIYWFRGGIRWTLLAVTYNKHCMQRPRHCLHHNNTIVRPLRGSMSSVQTLFKPNGILKKGRLERYTRETRYFFFFFIYPAVVCYRFKGTYTPGNRPSFTRAIPASVGGF